MSPSLSFGLCPSLSFCEARVVKVPVGPLVHVAGQAVSIRCDVSYYEGPRDQDFEWSLVLAGDKLLSLVSTFDSNFVDPSMRDRVNSGDINYNKLGDAAIELKFKKVRATDSGVYRCSTPSTDSVISGNYHADVELKVIADTLEASYSGSPSQSLSEGDPLQLECQVSSQTFQHTHLSVTWFLHGEEDEIPRPIITLDKDLTVKPGAGFEDGYRAGLISMDKVEDTTYRLKMPQVQQSDQGKFFCKAIEWIQDPDRSWTQIAHKTTTNNLHVHKEEQSLNISNLQAGFTIDCVIESRSSDASVFEVTWSRGQRNEGPVIIFNASRDGTLHSAIDDKDLVFGHPSAMHYKLTVPNVNPTDTGLYHCQVVEWIQTAANKWRKIGEDMSGKISVHEDTEERQKNVSFAMDKNGKYLFIKEGEQFDIECSLDVGKEDPTHHYSLRWVFNRPESTSGIPLLSYSYDGRLQYHTENQDRLRFSRPTSDTFHLAVLNSDIADSGRYQCRVEQYQLDCEGQWKPMARDQSGSTIVTVRSIGNATIYILSMFNLLVQSNY
uniref:Prostaglandin F2 receptor negative regulator-like n=1 Tax=Sinocyclocheilus rhinocerous TaxID=307959 RepID=A0A673GRV1_9TELE